MHEGKMIEFQVSGRTTPGYLATPAKTAGPGVLVLQEYWGLVDHIKDVADRFAAEGFVALAPDLYHGDSAKSPEAAGRKMMALDIERTSADLLCAAQYLAGLESVAPKKIGVVGFCMGGQLALSALIDHGEHIHAGVDFYGIHPNVKPDLTKLRRPLQAHFANDDTFVAEADARKLVGAIEAAGKSVDAHFYAAGHAFFNDSRPEAYDATAAKAAWERTLGFFRTNLV